MPVVRSVRPPQSTAERREPPLALPAVLQRQLRGESRAARLQGNKVFITIPRAGGLDFNKVAGDLFEYFKTSGKPEDYPDDAEHNVTLFLMVRELHQAETDVDGAEGEQHFHVLCTLHSRARVRFTTLDALIGKHGNYQLVRDPAKVCRYLLKDSDKESFLCAAFPSRQACNELAAAAEIKGTCKAAARALILQDVSFADVIKQYPAVALRHWSNCKKLHAYSAAHIKGAADLRPWPDLEADVADIQPGATPSQNIRFWLATSIRKDRPERSLQLWIKGVSCSGKNRLVNQLRTMLRIYDAGDESYHDLFDPANTDLIVLNEYNGQQPLPFFLKLTAGERMVIPQKGSQLLYEGGIPVLVLGNRGAEALYLHYPDAVRTGLMNRFMHVDFKEMHSINVEWPPDTLPAEFANGEALQMAEWNELMAAMPKPDLAPGQPRM